MHPHSVDSLSGLSVDSPQFRQRAPHIELSDDPDTATQQTVQEMCRQIHQAAGDPLVQRAARAAMAFTGGPSNVSAIDACWWWAKHFLRFKHHGEQFEVWRGDLGDPSNKLQLLIAPDVLVRMSRMEGDCAIYTMMVCAMLEALGVQWEIVAAAVDARQPDIFGHVWARAVLANGAREPLDASHGKYPGWQVPSYDLHRVWVFNSSGVRVAEQGPGFNGLHEYRRARGFGDVQCYEDGTCEDVPTGTNTAPDYTPTPDLGQQVASSGPTSTGQFIDYTTGKVYTGPTYTVPSSSSSSWANFAAAMGKAGMSLASINALKPGMVISPNGQMLYQNPGYAVGSAGSALNVGGLSTTTLMVGGLLLLGAAFMFSSRGR